MDARNSNLFMAKGVERNFFTDSVPNLFFMKAERVGGFVLPKKHRKDSESDDLPDITPKLMSRLNAIWKMADAPEEEPIKVVIEGVREHLDAINPYLEVLKNHERGWYNCWRFLYKIAEELDTVTAESVGVRFYVVPEDLRMQELRARMNLGKDEVDFKNAEEVYMTELDKRREKLVLLGSQIEEITAAQDIEALKKYDNSYAQQNIVSGSNHAKLTGCLLSLYSFFSCKRNVLAVNAASVAASPEEASQAFESMRARLLTEYNEDLRLETGMYNDFGDRAPTRSGNYRSVWNESKAKIYYDRLEYHRCQSKGVMLQCIRLYVLAFRTYYLIYGDNPLADRQARDTVAQKRIRKIYDDQDQVVFKVQDLFRQLIKGLKSEFSKFYCLQPCRREFSVYLDNYNSIPKAEDRDAVLAGKGVEDSSVFAEGKSMEDLVDLVFNDFESPEEHLICRA